MESFQIIRLWAAAAWADEALHPTEEAALKRLIDASDDLSATQRERAMGFLRSAPDVEVGEVANLSAEAREGVYRAAQGIVMLDRELVDSEKEFLDRLRGALDLDAETIARLDAES